MDSISRGVWSVEDVKFLWELILLLHRKKYRVWKKEQRENEAKERIKWADQVRD
jgi:hypothetical protein